MPLVQHEASFVSAPRDPMAAAIQQARSTISQFFRAHRVPRRTQTDFRIRAAFQDGDQSEQIWLSHLDFNTRPATGVVTTRPNTIRTVSYHKRVPFRPEQMTDWMYLENGRLIGGLTTGVQVSQETEPVGFLDRLKRRLVA